MGNKNIWIFNHYAITPNFPGGTRHYDFAKELVNRGYNVTIFASSFHYSLLEETKIYEKKKYCRENYDGVNFVWLRTFPYSKNNWERFINMLSYSKNVTGVIKTFDKEKPDIIIGSTVHPFAAFTAYRISKRYRVPFVFEIRDLWPQTMIDMGLWSETDLHARVFKMIEKKLVKNARAVIALSPLTQNYLLREYNYKEYHYIPNGVDLREFDKRKIIYDDSTKYNETLKYLAEVKRNNTFIVMFIGSIVLSNNIDVLIKSANIIKDYDNNIKIILVGKGQEKEKYETLIKNSNLNNIQIIEPIKKDFVPILLNYADVLMLIQGTVFWGSTNKLFDYLASGKPIITAVSSKHNDPVEEVKCGISVPSNSPEAIAKAIIKFHNMPKEEIDKMGKKGREYVEKYHAIPILVDRLENIIKNIVPT